jgi:hypothetical protein
MQKILALLLPAFLLAACTSGSNTASRTTASVTAACTCSPRPTSPPATPTPGLAALVTAQNTRSQNTVYPFGVPSSYGFQGGAVQENASPPSGYTSAAGWIVLAPLSTNAGNPAGAKVTLRLRTWIHQTTPRWTLFTDTNAAGWGGALYTASQYAYISYFTTVSNGPPIVVAAPVGGDILHMYAASRTAYAAGTVNGIYTVLTASQSGGTPIVAQTGADWYQYANKPQSGNPMPPGAGLSNWMTIDGKTQLHYLSNMSLVNNLPE